MLPSCRAERSGAGVPRRVVRAPRRGDPRTRPAAHSTRCTYSVTVTVRLPGAIRRCSAAPARRGCGATAAEPHALAHRADRRRDEHDRPGQRRRRLRPVDAHPGRAEPGEPQPGRLLDEAVQQRGDRQRQQQHGQPDGVPPGRGPAEQLREVLLRQPEHLEHRDVHQVEAVGHAPAVDRPRPRQPHRRAAVGQREGPDQHREGDEHRAAAARTDQLARHKSRGDHQRQRRGRRRRPPAHAVRGPPVLRRTQSPGGGGRPGAPARRRRTRTAPARPSSTGGTGCR